MNKKYYSIYLDVKNKILQGDFKAGEKLPSKRIMADKMGCSIVTVESAYAMLEEEGYIRPRERSGYFVERIDLSIGAVPTAKRVPLPHIKESHALPTERDFE